MGAAARHGDPVGVVLSWELRKTGLPAFPNGSQTWSFPVLSLTFTVYSATLVTFALMAELPHTGFISDRSKSVLSSWGGHGLTSLSKHDLGVMVGGREREGQVKMGKAPAVSQPCIGLGWGGGHI